MLNPLYQALLRGLRPGIYRIRDLAPDAFFDTSFCRSYRVTPRASEEIGYITENWPEGMEEILIVVPLEETASGEWRMPFQLPIRTAWIVVDRP